MSKIEKLPLPLLKILAQVALHFPKEILNLRYRRWTGHSVDWKHPSDLQQYIFANIVSLDDRRLALASRLADKVAMRDYVTERIGHGYLPELYGTWNSAETVDWDSLPEKFAIKTNNSCGTNIIVRDKSTLDIPDAVCRLRRWLEFPYGQLSGQPHYSLIQPMVLAEQLLEVEPGSAALPPDYKLFCFNGVPKYILYYEGRTVNGHLTPNLVYDTHWNRLDDIVRRPAGHDVSRPVPLDEMIRLASALSEGIDFVRVDFYVINDRPVVGELTFTPDVVINFKPEFLKEALSFINS